jgi:molybdopterin molybdotransferase
MIEFGQACKLIDEKTRILGTEEKLIEKAVGCVLARDVVSPINVSPFKNSAMDGFAVKSEWLSECSENNPIEIPLGPTLYAGETAPQDFSGKQTIKIMTGARVPDDFDAVIPIEDTDFDENEVRFSNSVPHGKHVRQQGEDIARGQKLFAAGKTFGRLDTGILAAIGLRTVLTYRKPSAIIIGTGDELTPPGEELTGDRIYDSNTFAIQSLIEPFCSSVERICRVPDRKDEVEKALCSSHDVIIASGGVSVGERDLVVDMAEACGWESVFHKVKIKPGKPFYFAVRDNQMLFGLPGNPLAAIVTCAVFLIPALKKMSGCADYRLSPQPATLVAGKPAKPGRILIWPGTIRRESSGMVADLSSMKSTAALTTLLGTDGLIIQGSVNGKPGDTSVGAVSWTDLLKL